MGNETKRLKGRVAMITSSRELVINIGQEQGVKQGMKFAVLAERPLEVRDPDSNRILDLIDREKVRVEASEVRELVTVCRTYRIRTIPGGSLYNSGIGELLQAPREVKETLAIEAASMPPPLPEKESYVKVGDRVIQTIDD
ncbi:MAG: hypothetical protein ABFD54_04215 [Armatimonadota bacterium]|nr:hypothetical protein [bacterium]